MSAPEHEEDIDKVSVTVVLEGDSAKKFLAAVKKSERTNRGEAKLRIEDHLTHWSDIASIGSRVKRI